MDSTMTSPARGWLLALVAAMLYTAAQTVRLAHVMPNVPWPELYLFELPVWLGVIAMSPVVFWLARRLPLFGPHAFRNFFAHLVPGALAVSLQFVLVEAMRRYLVSPLVIRTGIAATKPAIDYAMVDRDGSLLAVAVAVTQMYAVFWILIYFALAGFYYSFKYHRELGTTRLRFQELQTLLAQSQLNSLRLQIQPHFLFNTLNTVSSLMSRDVMLARRTLARLSDLLRTSLRDSTVHEVPLASELEFLDAYLEIQAARFGQRLVTEKQIDSDVASLLVPRMLLQPLVENSIRHGMRDGDRTLCVRIEAERLHTSLRIRIVDNGGGLPTKKLQEGVGLQNTRERLSQLYGVNQQMQIAAPLKGGFEVTLTIPARAAEPENIKQGRREIA
jgi:two-component system, LytTR family, sensor kinase